ncbi:MAG: PIG-L family deacetylase [Clostridia bacterium]|nr:PIG-L family deacetylase [Clostridia bacterium]
MKILCVGAHQDDNEFRVGGITQKWVKAGYEVRFLSMCNGDGGHHIMTPEETTKRRAGESAKVAEYLGIRYDVWSDVHDCTLMADLETRERLIRYIREFNPDLIVAHRPNDYHADHRASAQLVQDASYILTVPHTCPDVPAMRYMPVIVYNEDTFRYPPFEPTFIVELTEEEMERKLDIADFNVSQVYEWLPYTYGETVPEGKEERREFLRGIKITDKTTDEEILATKSGYEARFAKTASRHRQALIERYGEEKGKKIRYAEAFMLSEYGKQPDEELVNKLFYL